MLPSERPRSSAREHVSVAFCCVRSFLEVFREIGILHDGIIKNAEKSSPR